jgi:hypothetical protein
MTQGLLIIAKKKPIVNKNQRLYPIQDRMNIGYCWFEGFSNDICILGHEYYLQQNHQKVSGIIYSNGWFPINEILNRNTSVYLQSYLIDAVKSLPLSKYGDSWLLPCDTHDMLYDDLFLGLYHLILELNSIQHEFYRVEGFSGKLNILEKSEFQELSVKIERLNNDSNLLYNPEAVIVIRRLKSKNRYIACSEFPPNPKRIQK